MIEEQIITIKVLHATCSRCGHKWDLKRGVVPKTCAKCHSPYWNEPRKYRTKALLELEAARAKAEQQPQDTPAVDDDHGQAGL